MTSHFRRLWRSYWLLLLLYGACLVSVTWLSGVLPLERKILQMQRALPHFIILMLMGLNFSFGFRWLRRSKSELSPPLAIPSRKWWFMSLLVSLCTWLAFVGLLWWHEYPADSFGQAVRAIFGICSAAAIGYFLGRLSATKGPKWGGWAIVAMATGWMLGQTLCTFLRIDPDKGNRLDNIPEDGARKVNEIAFFPLLLIGLTAVGGIIWNRYGRGVKFGCAMMIPPMIAANIWDSILSARRMDAHWVMTYPSHAISHEFTGTTKLYPSSEPLLNSTASPYNKPFDRTWEFALPWVSQGDDPRIQLIQGWPTDLKLTSAGKSVPSEPWRFTFLRSPLYHQGKDEPLILRVGYRSPREVDPSQKSKKRTVPQALLPPQPRPKELRLNATLLLRGFKLAHTFPAGDTHHFIFSNLRGTIRTHWKKDSSYLREMNAQELTLDWNSESWKPIPAISASKDPFFGPPQKTRMDFAFTLTHAGKTASPYILLHDDEWGAPFGYASFFRFSNQFPGETWIPADSREEGDAKANSTVTFFHQIAVWQVPIELDLALP